MSVEELALSLSAGLGWATRPLYWGA